MTAETMILTLTPSQVNTLRSALAARSVETDGYLRQRYYANPTPTPMDECCEGHRQDFAERLRQRDSLLERQQAEHALAAILDAALDPGSAHPDGRVEP